MRVDIPVIVSLTSGAVLGKRKRRSAGFRWTMSS
jgi:hypothetical protein